MFTHLHVHTEGSALDGLARVGDAFETVRADGQDALAITDHGNLSVAWKAKQAAAARGMTFIPGIEVYVAVNSDGSFGNRHAPQYMSVDGDLTDDSGEDTGRSKKKRKHYYHLTLLAVSETGWESLVRLNNASAHTLLNGQYPGVDIDLLREHRDGIVALSGCLGGPVLGPVATGDIEGAHRNLTELVDVYGTDALFVEVMEHGIPQESRALPVMAELAVDYGLRLVATNDAHYSSDHHAHAHDAWLALRVDKPLDEQNRYRFSGAGYHLRTEEEMRSLRPEPWWQDACDNTQVIRDRVTGPTIPDGDAKLPKFPTPQDFTDNRQFLAHLVREGTTRVYGTPAPAEVTDRLNTEWQVIDQMGFVDYFLIVENVVSWAKSTRCVHDAGTGCTHPGCPGVKEPILVGPGRGSAAGSLLAYVLGITGVDPLEHDLLFERFLEPGRADWPDMDIDFEKSKFETVLDYLEHTWGDGHVARIGSFAIEKSRRAIKDAARVLGVGSLGAKLTKLVPVVEGNPLTFDELFADDPSTAEFRRELAKAGEDGERVMHLAQTLYEVIAGVGIHACGVVISDRYLPDLVPLRAHKGTGRLVTQWDSKDAEAFGLLKLDILSLRNLDIAKTTMGYIRETTGEELTLASIPHPDTKGDPRVDAAWRLLRDGRTAGIFQMEGAAMTSLAQDVQPETVSDLSAILALFRPGPISAGMPDHYALRKNGKEPVDYGLYTEDASEQAAIASRLGNTYGLLIFQESLMLLGTTVAGFDVAMRSKLRKAIGKKNKKLMAEVKTAFLAGAPVEHREGGELVSQAFMTDTAERLWAMFEGAASYAFNASHSYAYAYLAYWTAYLKANWPGAYGAAILAHTDKAETRHEALTTLPGEGIAVLPPDVNLSRAMSAPEGESAVRIGLSEVSGVGEVASHIVAERERSGRFEDLRDVLRRVNVKHEDDTEGRAKAIPMDRVLSLIEAGAMDDFGPRYGLTVIARMAGEALPAPVPDMEWGVIERSARQRHRLGVSMGEHPLTVFRSEVAAWRKRVSTEYGDQALEGGIPIGAVPQEAGATVTVIGLLGRWAEKSYSKGRMAVVTLEGSSDRIEGVMWDRELTAQKASDGVPPVGWPVAVTARVTVREFEQEDEDGRTTITRVRQLNVNRVDVIDVHDPVVGGLSADGVLVPVLTARAGSPAPEGTVLSVVSESAAVAPADGDSATEAASSDVEPASVPVFTVKPRAFGRLILTQLPADFPQDLTLVPHYVGHETGDFDVVDGGCTVARVHVTA